MPPPLQQLVCLALLQLHPLETKARGQADGQKFSLRAERVATGVGKSRGAGRVCACHKGQPAESCSSGFPAWQGPLLCYMHRVSSQPFLMPILAVPCSHMTLLTPRLHMTRLHVSHVGMSSHFPALSSPILSMWRITKQNQLGLSRGSQLVWPGNFFLVP